MYSKFYFLLYLKLLFLTVYLTEYAHSNEENNVNQKEDMFKKLFKIRRAEQLEAVKKMAKMEEDKQIKMVKTVTKTIFDVIQKSRVVLENSGYTPGVSEFPETESVRDALSLVLENTALMGDIVLRMPEITDRVLRSTDEGLTLLVWSLRFTNETQLLDNTTMKLLHLVSQELNLTERDPDYINPYRKVKQSKQQAKEENNQLKKKTKKPPTPRGPRLTIRQTGEL